MIGFQCNPQKQHRAAAEAEPQQASKMPADIKTGVRASQARDQHLPQLTSRCQLGAQAAVGEEAPARRVSSPGYHSAASSPGSSSIASPVGSSASTASSSGVSSAASLCNRPTSRSPGPAPARQQQPTLSTAPAAATLAPNTTSSAHDQPPGQATLVSCTTAPVSRAHLATTSPGLKPNSQQQALLKQEVGQARSAVLGAQQANLLDHFPGLDPDGLRLSWFHGANNRATLDCALASRKLIVAGDISLAEMSRYPVPIMARPPLGVSDLTLETWLSDVIQSRKGIKLTFTSTRTVEPAFRVLARHAQHLKGPLILSADILARPSAAASPSRATAKQSQHQQNQQQQQPSQDQQPVDAWTFLMLCRTRFPRSIVSIGWCPAPGRAQTNPSARPADSSRGAGTGPSESMFELDLAMEQPQPQPSVAVSQAPHFSQPLLHLSTAPSGPARLNSLSVVQQLAAVAAAAAANNNAGAHPAYLRQLPRQQADGQQRHHFILSSNGSLNSSSGNSSGSPSPTSPVSHLMSPAHHHQHHAHQLQHPHGHHQHHQSHHLLSRSLQDQRRNSSAGQLILAAAAERKPAHADPPRRQQAQQAQQRQQQHSSQVVGWPAMAAAAMVAASNLRRLGAHEDDDEDEDEDEDEPEAEHEHEHEHDEEEEDDQLPLNLNINEADPQHATSASSALNDLAQKIQSLQQQSSNLNALTSSLSKRAGPQASVDGTALALAGRLFAGDPNRWEHISKKAAFAHQLNADSPSPVPTSPKHQHQHQQHSHQYQHHQTSGSLLCVKPQHSLANLAFATQTAVSQPFKGSHAALGRALDKEVAAPLQQPQPAPSQAPAGESGYTREMIDKMASLVKEYNLTQAVTFPVEARLALRNNSLAELQRLLYQVGAHSTLTIVAQQEDLISVEDLLTIRRHFAATQLLFDLPEGLAAALRRELDR